MDGPQSRENAEAGDEDGINDEVVRAFVVYESLKTEKKFVTICHIWRTFVATFVTTFVTYSGRLL